MLDGARIGCVKLREESSSEDGGEWWGSASACDCCDWVPREQTHFFAAGATAFHPSGYNGKNRTLISRQYKISQSHGTARVMEKGISPHHGMHSTRDQTQTFWPFPRC
jgi:hypothetical protein